MKFKKEDLPQTDGEWKYNSTLHRWCSMFNGQFHNSLGPAVIYTDGHKEWFVRDERHRLDGPAIEWADGHKEWHVSGKRVSEQDFPFIVISFLLGIDKETTKIIEQEMKK